MSGQADIRRKHEPKRKIADERNIDKHRDQREKSNNERYYVHAEDIKHADSCNTHSPAS